MIQEAESTLQQIKKKQFAPCYFLHGEESYYIDAISEAVETQVLEPAERGLNQILLYGKDTDIGTIVQQARRYPMMAERQVIIVKEFQQTPDIGRAESKKLLENYLKQPVPSTVLVLCHKHKALAKNTTLYKALEAGAVVVEAKKMTDAKVGEWIGKYVAEHRRSIGQKAVQMLLEAVGADLSRLQSEIDKVLTTIPEGGNIDEQTLERLVGISKDYNIFELQNALGIRQSLQVFKILQYWEANPKKQPLIPTIAMLFQFFTKLLAAYASKDRSDAGLAKVMGVPPFAVKNYKTALQHYNAHDIVAALEALYIADLQSKGIEGRNLPDHEVLKELMGKILYRNIT
ncbi:DNA polymerase III subunit delta [Eisenibacter elegans]|jgi:DNA polymerase-3 subunit delta|uniref:DNA polymerase III subunit delta n=1 Tax=Eisenibacter elegans TaxID=997 RepID=UPI00047A78E7|nr:DNA polymerase III subunit delta [Eisenibacter elegans]